MFPAYLILFSLGLSAALPPSLVLLLLLCLLLLPSKHTARCVCKEAAGKTDLSAAAVCVCWFFYFGLGLLLACMQLLLRASLVYRSFCRCSVYSYYI